MSYREIPKNKILKFPATPAFKGWRDHFTDESVAHPAKMNLNLLRHILEKYTKPGDVVLDPMAGTGSTVILASLLGRHGIAVELEPHFVGMIRENIKRTERQSTLTPKGSVSCIQGDARELSKLLGGSDTIITSPPYSESMQAKHDPEKEIQRLQEKVRQGAKYVPWTMSVAKRGYWNPHAHVVDTQPYSDDPRNIGNLKHGDIEAIISSPPYEASISKKNQEMERLLRLYRSGKLKGDIKRRVGEWIRNPDKNLGFIAGQEVSYTKDIDVMISSPPYEGSNLGGGDQEARRKRLIESGHDVKEFFGGKARGATLRPYDEVDVVIYSPPYGNRLADDVVQDGDKARMSYRQAVDSIVTSPPYEGTISGEGGGSLGQEESQSLKTMREYSEDPENIGNLKTNSYLEAMLQVYRECFKVGGKLILVTKNFIRDKQVVRLDLDTIRLCEAAGFHLSDRWYFKLPTKSFWKIIYSQKYPDVPEVEYEDILIFTKEAEE